MKKIIITFTIILIILFMTGCTQPYSPGGSSSTSSLAGNGDLIITEVGSGYYANGSFWVEVYNRSSEVGNLSKYKLKSWAYDTSISSTDLTTFDLPSLVIQPGGYAIIRGKSYKYLSDGDNIVYISSGTKTPYWQISGNIELLLGGITNDFVRFGTSKYLPATSGNWDTSSAPALPTDYGKSISRDGSNTDTNNGTDWTLKDFATFAGPNDVVSSTDLDGDGIPDESERVSGNTFAGLALYDWGARTGQKDIFIHVNYMDSTDEGIIPREEALQKVVDAFRAHDIAIHFDVGDLYDQATGINPSKFDLDDKNHKVPFTYALTMSASHGKPNLYSYKNKYMDLARKQIFHYLLFGNTQNGRAGVSGQAEANGNDFMVTLGEGGLHSHGETDTNYLINFQAASIMHELGHNLGLGHGGVINDSENYKPNYISTMNYLYELSGLPTYGDTEGDRYYFKYDIANHHGIKNYSDLNHGPEKTTFKINYSDGTAMDINEKYIIESEGLRWGADNAIDYNLDNDTTDIGLSMSINRRSGPTDKGTTIIRDYNDWANLNFFFIRNGINGDTTGASIYSSKEDSIIIMQNPAQDDFQQIYPEYPHKNLIERMKQN